MIFWCSIISLFSFLFPVIFQFSKNSLFSKKGCKIGFSIFSVLSYFFANSLFLALLKHYKNRGFSKFGFFVVEREGNRQKTKDNWNLWILVFWSKNGHFVTHICFPKKGPETPILIVFWGWALLGPRCQKREILKSHPTKNKNLTDNWKAIFWYFCCLFWASFFLFFFPLFFLFCYFWVFCFVFFCWCFFLRV